MTIGLDGSLTDWTAADRLEKVNLGAAGVEIYGRFEEGKFLFAIKSAAPIGANTTLWLNTDRDSSTGYQVFGGTVGAEYHIQFDLDGVPRLYNSVTSTLVADLVHASSADGTILEFELTSAQLGGAVGAITFTGDLNDTSHLSADYAAGGFTVYDLAANPLDGILTEWTHADRLETSANAQAGYEVYGKAVDGSFQLALKSAVAISAGTTFWLNTDHNSATGYNVFGSPTGSDYRVEIDAGGTARLYVGDSSTSIATLNSKLGLDQLTLELTIPKTLVGGTDRVDIVLDVNQNVFIPGDYNANPPLTLVDTTATQHPESGLQKVAIVYSETTAQQYFSTMAYSQLFMAAQSQAMAAGIPFDVISEADLTDLSKLSQYDALIFPSFRNVPANYDQITETLTRLIYDYDVSLIAAGDFMTNDANNGSLPGYAYARMDLLFGVHRTGGDSGDIKVVATPSGHAITDGYGAGGTIHDYKTVTYTDGTTSVPATSYFEAGNSAYAPTTTIASQIINGTTHDAVIGTETGARNVLFATEAFLADSNLLGKAIDWVTEPVDQPSVSLHMSRNTALVASRTDMDQSQESYDVDGEGNAGIGIYDVMLPILQDWKAQFNFIGSYYINVGVNPPDQETNWLISKPYYDALLAMGNEIGSHSYTHPQDTNFLVGVVDTDAKLAHFLELYNAPQNENHNAAVAQQLAQLSLADYNSKLAAALAASDPTTLDALSKAILTTTFQFQFEVAKQVLETHLGITIGGAAVPGMPESLATAREIIQYFDYISGGASLVGAGYPGALGYLTPGETDKVYLAPNMSFDFTLMGWQNLTIEEAKAAWAAEWAALNANSDLPIAVWPWHDYGPTEWVIDSPNPSDYQLDMFTHFIQTAYNSGAEFVTLADLAARIEAFEKVQFSFTVTGDLITAKATPQGGVIGTFALDLDDLGSKTIKAVTNWYAYDGDSVFLDLDGGEFQIQLGTASDDVTHITKLDQRMQLVSLTGDGASLNFTVAGEGLVTILLKDYLGSPFTVSGASVVSQVGDQLTLNLAGIGNHNVEVKLVDQAPTAISVTDQITLEENTATRTKVGTVVIADLDLDPRLQQNMVLVSDDRFVFDQTDGGLYLLAGQTIDYETAPTISLDLSTGPDGAIKTSVVLNVGDANEAPTDIQISNQIVLPENTAVRTKIADLSVIDPDTNAAFRNNILSVSDARFEISDGALYLKAGQVVDFEATQNIPLTLTATDGTLTFSKSIALAVSDVAEHTPSMVMQGFAPSAGGWVSDDRYPRQLADVNGDGKADIVAFGEHGVSIALANGQGGFNAPTMALQALAPSVGGWVSDDRYPRQLADVNGDGKADIVAFGEYGVSIALANGQGGFNAPTMALQAFAPSAGGWVSNDRYPRQLADVNGDGKADIVAFGEYGVSIALANGQGGFNAPTMALQAFAPSAGGWVSNDRYPRQLADVNGDGKADIVAFGEYGVSIALADGQGGFNAPTMALQAFAPSAGGWVSNDRYPRQLADVNGDGKADIVAFGEYGVSIALANGQGSFDEPTMALQAFAPSAGGWVSDDRYPRQLADINGDGKADIVAFGEHGVFSLTGGDWFL